MEIFLVAISSIFIYLISAYGWGGLVNSFIYTSSTNSKAYDVTVGLAIWVFIGGILNALGLAYSIVLDVIFVLGIVLFGILFFRFRQKKKGTNQQSLQKDSFIPGENRIGKFLTEIIPPLIIFFAASFLIITILPANSFNHHDDFYKYFPRLFRMLQSGKLGGTPFDYIGRDSLGAQAFLQSFVAAHFPLRYINGFDAIFCFLLGGLLLNDIGRKAELPCFLRSCALVAFIVINHQYVNISALYSGSLMILALIYSSLLLCDCLENKERKEMLWAVIPFALIASTLVALKITFVPFTVSYCLLFLLLLVLFSKPRKNIMVVGSTLGAAIGIMLVPWLWSVYDKVIFVYHLAIRKMSHGNLSKANLDSSDSVFSKLFSSEKLFYGGNVSDYNFIIICSLAVAFGAGYFLIKKKDLANKGKFIVVMSTGISLTIAYLINGHFARDFEVGIRYTCPIILAALPTTMLLFYGKPSLSMPVTSVHNIRIRHFSALLILGISIGLFMHGWFGRLNQLVEQRSMLSFPINKSYVVRNKNSLSKLEQESVRSMQERTEEKTSIMAWFETSFFLDFKRNSIFTVGSPGIVMNTGGFNLNNFADSSLLGNYFRDIGIRYVIWGYNDPPKALYNGTKELTKGLKDLSEQSKVIYDDGRRVVFEIN
jgi:hypothetical protein